MKTFLDPNDDQMLVDIFNQYWTESKSIEELSVSYNITPDRCMQFVNSGRELNNIEGVA